MLVHFRLTVPADLGHTVRDLLLDHPCVTNVTSQPGAVLQPPGDLVEADVAREQAAHVLRDLQGLGLHESGGIVLSNPSGTPFRKARDLDVATPGHPDDAVIWESVETAAHAGAAPTLSFHVFLVLAVALAAVAVVTDSAVLVVGAMVVGPEYSAIAALSAGLVLRNGGLVWRSARLVAFSFAFSVVVVALLALLARGVGLVTDELVDRPRPNTGFIYHPDAWSPVVAALAGAAGALALAIERSATMVGVFISVTTVPALGNMAVGLAVWDGDEVLGATVQLGLNLAGMIVAGVVTLLLVRTVWPALADRSERIFGYHEHV